MCLSTTNVALQNALAQFAGHVLLNTTLNVQRRNKQAAGSVFSVADITQHSLRDSLWLHTKTCIKERILFKRGGGLLARMRLFTHFSFSIRYYSLVQLCFYYISRYLFDGEYSLVFILLCVLPDLTMQPISVLQGWISGISLYYTDITMPKSHLSFVDSKLSQSNCFFFLYHIHLK